MSGLPFVELGDLDGTHGWVKTKGFVNWTEDVDSHQPRQRVKLGDDTTREGVVCTVWTDDIELEGESATTSAASTTPTRSVKRFNSSSSISLG